jgi:hypothetical protein
VIDSRGEYDPMRETEALIRSAANYVRVSPDLRPLVLEAARLNTRERNARRVIHRVAVIAVILISSMVSRIDRVRSDSAARELQITPAGAILVSGRVGGIGADAWAFVDAFTELRDRQADALQAKP